MTKPTFDRHKLFSVIEIILIVSLACVPLFATFPYRVNIFLSWEGRLPHEPGTHSVQGFRNATGVYVLGSACIVHEAVWHATDHADKSTGFSKHHFRPGVPVYFKKPAGAAGRAAAFGVAVLPFVFVF
jgi:hypothetical protein